MGYLSPWICADNDLNDNTPFICTPVCGDGMTYGSEQCDDGYPSLIIWVNGDGCDEFCNIEQNYTCTTYSPGDWSICVLKCGNGYWEAGE